MALGERLAAWLVADADSLFKALVLRKAQIHRLLVSTSTLSTCAGGSGPFARRSASVSPSSSSITR